MRERAGRLAAVAALVGIAALAWIAETRSTPADASNAPASAQRLTTAAPDPAQPDLGPLIPPTHPSDVAAPIATEQAAAAPDAIAAVDELVTATAPAADAAAGMLEADAVDAEPGSPFVTFTGTTVVSRGEINRGDSLASAMARSNVPSPVIHLVATEASKVFDFRRAQPGHRFELTQSLDGRVLDFAYRTSSIESIHLKLEGGEYVARREQVQLDPRIARMAGVVNSSLYGAIMELGEEPQLANDFTEVFAWDVDFARTVQHGDEFRVLYERLYYTDDRGREAYAGPGRILAARYGGSVGEHVAIYFETEEGRGGYYRPDGSSMERQFLMAPLSYSRISSNFTLARLHPILNITRPHEGIDYAAAQGTPVWSVANGEVIYRGWAGGFGNLVKIRHADGYVSYYGHLSKFARGLRVGSKVQQKEVIGLVGSTGLATGPHVCFRIAKDGRYVNPARVQSPAAKPIAPSAKARFAAVRDSLMAQLNSGVYVETQEAL